MASPRHARPSRVKTVATSLLASVCATSLWVSVALADMNGIDVSGWQPSTITQAVPSDFAIVKVTEGTWYTNPNWTAQANGTTSTGKALGLYHYADGGNAISEADGFVNTTAAYHGKAMLVLDWEQYGNFSWGNGAWVRQFVNRVHERTSVWPVVYVQRSAVWQIPSDVRQQCMLWVAQYASDASTGYQDSPWNAGASGEGMIQYTSHGVLPGYSSWLDLNRFLGDRTAWQKIACGERKGCAPTTSTGTASRPASTTPSTSSTGVNLDALASAVIRGEYGNNPQRRQLLGADYDKVMYIVNRRLGVSTAPTATPASTTRNYVVQPGDTVSAIAQRSGCLPVGAWSVPSGNINLIYVGQTITYHGSSAAAAASGHTVRTGESLWSIYGSGWAAAAARNGLQAPYTIYPGQVLH